jgi:hypothetical protein
MKITGLKAIQPDTPEAPKDWRTWFGLFAGIDLVYNNSSVDR